MNLVSLCLKIPNLGIFLFYLIFVVILPYILILNGSIEILKYYLPMLVAFANLLSKSGNKKIFENLYDLQPNNFVSFLSSNFINLFALFGILWQCLEYSKTRNGNVTKAVIYGTILFIIAFPLARNGLVYVLDHVDFYLREKTDLTYRHNWHLLVFGLLFIIFLLGLQAVLLALVDSTDPKLKSKVVKENKPPLTNKNNKNNKNNKKEKEVSNKKNENNKKVAEGNLNQKSKLNNSNKNSRTNSEVVNDLLNKLGSNQNQQNQENQKNKKNSSKLRNILNNKTLTNVGSISNIARKLR